MADGAGSANASRVVLEPVEEPAVSMIDQQGNETLEVPLSSKESFLNLIRQPEVQDRVHNASRRDLDKRSVKEAHPVPPPEVWHTLRHQITQAYGEIDQLFHALRHVQHDQVISASHTESQTTSTPEQQFRDLAIRTGATEARLSDASTSLDGHISRIQGVVTRQRKFLEAITELRSRWLIKPGSHQRPPAIVSVDVSLTHQPRKMLLPPEMKTAEIDLLCTKDGGLAVSAVHLGRQLAGLYPVMTMPADQVYLEGSIVECEKLFLRFQRALTACQVFRMLAIEAFTRLKQNTSSLKSDLGSLFSIVRVEDSTISLVIAASEEVPPRNLTIALDRDVALKSGDLLLSGADATTHRILNLYFLSRLRKWQDDAASHTPPQDTLVKCARFLLHARALTSAENAIARVTRYAIEEWDITLAARWEPVLEDCLSVCTIANGDSQYLVTVQDGHVLLPPLAHDSPNFERVCVTELISHLLVKVCLWKLERLSGIATKLRATVTRDRLTLVIASSRADARQRTISLQGSVAPDRCAMSITVTTRGIVSGGEAYDGKTGLYAGSVSWNDIVVEPRTDEAKIRFLLGTSAAE